MPELRKEKVISPSHSPVVGVLMGKESNEFADDDIICVYP